MFEAADPGYDALDAHAETGMRHAAEASQIQVPLERFFRKLVLFDAPDELVIVLETLTTADDFAVSLGRENVARHRDLRPLRMGLEVERLDGARIARHRNRTVEVL